MLQLVQSTLRRQLRVRRASSRSELLHQLQQVQNFLLAKVPSLPAHSHKTGWDSAGAASVTALLNGFLYYTGIFAPSVVAAIASGLWTWSWKWFWLMLGACSALTILIQIFLYLLQ